jgi:hypothetical protein
MMYSCSAAPNGSVRQETAPQSPYSDSVRGRTGIVKPTIVP